MVMSADHLIEREADFRQAVAAGIPAAQHLPVIVLGGAKPTTLPEEWTRLGAIKAGEPESALLNPGLHQVVAFVEKPDLRDARNMIEENRGDWYWNMGLFFFRISTMEKALKACQPSMYKTYIDMVQALKKDPELKASELYRKFPEKIRNPSRHANHPANRVGNTIDYAVLTPLLQLGHPPVRCAVVTSFPPWVDVGHYETIAKIATRNQRDRQGNILIGNSEARRGVRNSTIVADPGESIVVEGDIKDSVISQANGRLLLISKRYLNEIRQVTDMSNQHEGELLVKGRDAHNVRRIGEGSTVVFAYGVSNIEVEVNGKKTIVRAAARRATLSGPPRASDRKFRRAKNLGLLKRAV